MRSTSPAVAQRGEHRTRSSRPGSSTVWHRNLSPAFFCSAPGSRPASREHLEAVADADDGPHRRRRGRRPRPSPARTGRSRRCAGSRRGRSRRGPRPRRRPGGSPRRATPARPGRRAARPTCATSSSQFVPGKTHDADVHGLTRCEPGYPARGRSFTVTVYASITGLARSRWHISSTWARAVGLGRRLDDEPDRLADRAPATRCRSRARGAPARPSRPAGRRCPGRCVTSTTRLVRRGHGRLTLARRVRLTRRRRTTRRSSRR